MKIKLLAIVFLVSLFAVPSWGAINTDSGVNKDPTAGTIYTATDCNVAAFYPDGTLCQDTDDNKLYLGTGAAVVEIYPGLATTVTVADTADTTTWPMLATDAAADVAPKTDAALTYNANTGELAATKFSGALNGTVGATTPAAGTFTTLNAGGTGFAVDADGDVTGKSFSTAKQSGVAGLSSVYEANSTDTSYIGQMGPASISESYSFQYSSTQPTAGQAMVYAVPTGTGDPNGNKVSAQTWVTPATLTGTETLTNKTLTAPIATLARVDGSAAISPLSAAQVSGTVIRNTGQALADVNHTLPQAAAGYNFIAFVGTTLAATNYWRFTADASPQDYMCLDGTCGKTYVSVDTPTRGDTLTCYTEQISGTGIKNEANLAIGTSAATSVKNTAAVEFDIAGTGYSKAIAETAPGNDVIPQNKFGGVGFEVGVDGTIHAMEAADNATGYDTAALALAAAQAVALTDANHTRLGYVTASKSDGTFTFGTTELSAANTTVEYTDVTVYTPPFGWICITGKGTWTTD